MPDYVIGSTETLEIGKVYSGLRSAPWSHDETDQPFRVLKETTRQEFLKWHESMGGGPIEAVAICTKSSHFYEIQTD
jgi:hypothetical protein